jgi:GT2 family glycosyltransferase
MTDDPLIARRNGQSLNVDADKPPPLVSILIPCCGMVEYTKLLVPSILKNTRPPYEMIFIDIGSLDGTADYLAGVATVHPTIRVEVVRTPTDLGIEDACKEAIAKASGECLVLLNNDTVVTRGWLNQLLGLLNCSPAIAMAGPMSNYAAPPQLVESIPYRIGPKKAPRFEGRYGPSEVLVETEAVETFARDFREKNRGKWSEVERLSGFCLVVKREALVKIGPLDEWTDLSLFDTGVLSAKAREAGYKLACCRDLFIHHFGTRTFASGAPEKEVAQRENLLAV